VLKCDTANSKIRTNAADKTQKPSQMKVKALKFTKITDFTEISVFFMEEGQFHGKCHGREIVN